MMRKMEKDKIMKREPWAIANTFAYAVRVLNCIFCRHPEEEGWTEDDKEASGKNHWLIAEQINSMCSDMMIEDAQDMLVMVASIPTGRLCEEIDCKFHHYDNLPPFDSPAEQIKKRDYTIFKDKCGECPHNKKSEIEKSKQKNHFDIKK